MTNWRYGFEIGGKPLFEDRRPESLLVREGDMLTCGARCPVHEASRLVLEMVEAWTRFPQYHRLMIVPPVINKKKRWRRKLKAWPFHIKMKTHLALSPVLAFAMFRIRVVDKNHAPFAGRH
jgi:hypothetical protein